MASKNIPIFSMVSPTSGGRSQLVGSTELTNFYLSTPRTSGNFKVIAYPTPGLTVELDTGTAGPIRALISRNNIYYGVSADKFFQYSPTLGYTVIQTLDDVVGAVSIVTTTTQIIVNTPNSAYVYSTTANTSTKITDPDFPVGCSKIATIDSYTVAYSGGSIYISAPEDALTWDTLDFAVAEANKDSVASLYTYQNRLLIHGTGATEVWYDAGDPTFPLARYEGVYIEYGQRAPQSEAHGDNACYWLGVGKGTVSVVALDKNLQVSTVSTEEMDTEIKDYSRIDDAVGFVYQRDGHEFYQLTFPTADKTWLYDTRLNAWYRRTSTIDYLQTRHIASCHCEYNGKNLVGDYRNGLIYRFDNEAYTDNGATILRKIVYDLLFFATKYVILKSMELEFEPNKSTQSGSDAPNRCMYRISKDAGVTYTEVGTIDVPLLDKADNRIKKNSLGRGRRVITEFTFSDPIEWIIAGMWLDIDISQT